MASRTRAFVSSGICGLSRTTRETVARETPASAATSFIVVRGLAAPTRPGRTALVFASTSGCMGRSPGRHRRNKLSALDLAAPILGDQPAFTHDEQSVAKPKKLVYLVRDHQDGLSLVGEATKDAVDLRFRANVNAGSRLIDDEDIGP